MYSEFENLSTCGGRYLYATSGKDLLAKLISLKEDEDDYDDDDDSVIGAMATEQEAGEARGAPVSPDAIEVSMNSENISPGEIVQHTSQQPIMLAASIREKSKRIELSPQQVVMLNDALHVDQIHALINGPKRTLRFITEQLIAIVTQDTQPAPSFEDQYLQWKENVQSTGSSSGRSVDRETAMNDVTQWLAPGQEGGRLLTHCRCALAAGAALMRILSCHTPCCDVAPVDEEIVEGCVRWAAALVTINCGAGPLKVGPADAKERKAQKVASSSMRSKQDLTSGSASRMNSSSYTKGNKSTYQDVQKVMNEMGASLLPFIKASLDTLELLLNTRRQPDRLCIATYELCVSVLRAEPASCPRAELATSVNSFPLQATHTASIYVLQTMGGRYPTHRSAILSELVLLLSATHSCKAVGRTFPVHFSMHAVVKREKGTHAKTGGLLVPSSAISSSHSGSTGNTQNSDRYISTSFATLLLFIQSAAGAESAQSLLGESQRLCKSVVGDLLTRAAHKDMGGDYRLLLTSLLSQIETALSSPLMPVCAMLLDTLLARALSDLFTLSNEKGKESIAAAPIKAGNTSDRGTEQSFVNFLLEIVGNTGQILRCVVLGGARTVPSLIGGSTARTNGTGTTVIKAEGTELSTSAITPATPSAALNDKLSTTTTAPIEIINPRVLRALKQKLQKQEEEWLQRQRRPAVVLSMLLEEDKDELCSEAAMVAKELTANDLEADAQMELDDETLEALMVIDDNDNKMVSDTISKAFSQSEEKAANMKATNKRQKKAKKKDSSTADVFIKEEPVDDPFGGGSFSIEQTLRILGEVTGITLDAIAEYEQVNCGESESTISKRHTDFGAEPLNILKLTGCHKILSLMAPVVQAVDVSRYLICEYMRSIAINTGADGTAYNNILSLWYKDCTDTGRLEVAGYVEQCLKAVPLLLQQQKEYADRNAVPPTVVTGPYSEHIAAFKAIKAAGIDHDLAINKCTKNNTSSSNNNPMILSFTRPLWESRMSFEWVQRSYHALLAEWFGMRQYESIVALLLNLMATEHSSLLRARAIKTLNVLFQTDSSLISRPLVCKAVTRRLNDTAISVREETVKLIGSFVLEISGIEATTAKGNTSQDNITNNNQNGTTTAASDEYLDGLLLRLRDRGVSVRKAVVILIRELLLRQISHPRYSELCLALLERSALPKEEDSIKDTIRTTFYEIWLTIPKHRELLPMNNTTSRLGFGSRKGSTVALSPQHAADHGRMSTSTSNERLKGTFEISISETNAATIAEETSLSSKCPAGVAEVPAILVTDSRALYIESIAMQIIDVISSSHNISKQDGIKSELDVPSTLTSLIQGVLHGKSDGDEESAAAIKRREQSTLHCESLLKAFLEILLKLEEGYEPLEKVYGRKRSREAQIVGTIFAISVFCSAHPPLLLPHLSALLPYLKTHSALNLQQHSDVTLQVCRMLSAVAVIADSSGTLIHTISYAELSTDLTQIALTGNYSNVDAAVKCLAVLGAHVMRDVQPFMRLASKCFAAIRAMAISFTDYSIDPNTGKLNVAVSSVFCARVQRCLIVLGAICEHSILCTEQLSDLARRQVQSSINTPVSTLPTAIVSVSTPSTIDGSTLHTSSSAATVFTSSIQRAGSQGSLQSIGSLGQLENLSATTHKDRTAIEEAAANTTLLQLTTLGPATINGCVHAAAVFALTLPDESCEIRAVQALCRVYIGCPKLISCAQSNGLLTRLLGQAYTSLFHEKLLGGLNHMLLAEETRLEGKQSLKDMHSAGVKVGEAVLATTSDRDGDVSIAAAAVLAHQKRIIDFLYSANKSLRSEALDLLATVLRQGMLCPLDIISHLIALQADPDELLRQRSLRLLQTLDEKYASFVDNRLLDGFEAAYLLSICTTGSAQAIRTVDVRNEDGTTKEVLSASIFAALYKTLVQPSKARRTALPIGLLKRTNALLIAIRRQQVQLTLALERQSDQYHQLTQNPTIGVLNTTNVYSELSSPSSTNFSAASTRAQYTVQTYENSIHSSPVSSTANDIQGTIISQHKVIPVTPTEETMLDVKSILQTIAHLQGTACYFITILAHLPYESAAEPLQIIQWITRNVPVDASILCAALTTTLSKVGVITLANNSGKAPMQPPTAPIETTTSAIIGDGNQARMSARSMQANLVAREAELDSYQLILDETRFQLWFQSCKLWEQTMNIPSHNHHMDETQDGSNITTGIGMTSDTEIMASMLIGNSESRCREGLLRLKAFLKQSYNLSTERCQAYITHVCAQETRIVSEIIRTCDDANSGGKVKVLTQIFTLLPNTAVPHAPGNVGGCSPYVLDRCLALKCWPPQSDDFIHMAKTCVSDLSRLSLYLISDEDATLDHRSSKIGTNGQAHSNVNNHHKKRSRVNQEVSKSRKSARRTIIVSDSDEEDNLSDSDEDTQDEDVEAMEVIGESKPQKRASNPKGKKANEENNQLEHDEPEDDRCEVPQTTPRISSSGRTIKAPTRLMA